MVTLSERLDGMNIVSQMSNCGVVIVAKVAKMMEIRLQLPILTTLGIIVVN